MSCPRCGHRSAEGVLRCESCDAWLSGAPQPDSRPPEDEEGTRRVSPSQPGRALKAPSEATLPLASRLLVEDSPACPSCHAKVGADWRFCQGCGCPLQTSPRHPPGSAEPPAARLRHVLVELDIDGLAVRRTHELREGVTVVGRVEGDVRVPSDPAMSTRHAALELEGRRCVIRDLGSTNGTFVALTRGEPLEPGSVLLAGSQRLLLRSRPDREGDRGAELVQVLPLGHTGRTMSLSRDSIVIGKSSRADFAFPDDQYLSRRHCEVVHTGRGLVVRDLGSTNRTYLIVRDERPLEDGDRIVLGEQLFEYRVEER